MRANKPESRKNKAQIQIWGVHNVEKKKTLPKQGLSDFTDSVQANPSLSQITTALRELIAAGEVVKDGYLVSPNKLAQTDNEWARALRRQLGLDVKCELKDRMIRRAADLLADEGLLLSGKNRRAGRRVIRKRRGYIGLVSSGTRLDFMGRVIEGIDEALDEYRRAMGSEGTFRLICELSKSSDRENDVEKEERIVRELKSVTDGLIILPVRSAERSGDIARYVSKGFPIVLLGQGWMHEDEEIRSEVPIVAYREDEIARKIADMTKPLMD